MLPKNCWYVAAAAHEIGRALLKRTIAEEQVILYRTEAGKPVAFICHAGWVPMSAGIVRGRRGTSVGAIKDDLINAGMLWEDSAVVVDGNLITSRTPADLPHFSKAIIQALAGEGSEVRGQRSGMTSNPVR